MASIRKDMAAYVAERKPSQFDPVVWMRERLSWELSVLTVAESPDKLVDRQHAPHAQLMMAWDVISQPHYKSAYHRGLVETSLRDDARVLGHTITLDPNESKLLDAMAEAVGIPNTFGQMTPDKKESSQ